MVISVASGKGGTGKTLVATSLALSLSDNYKVQLLASASSCGPKPTRVYFYPQGGRNEMYLLWQMR